MGGELAAVQFLQVGRLREDQQVIDRRAIDMGHDPHIHPQPHGGEQIQRLIGGDRLGVAQHPVGSPDPILELQAVAGRQALARRLLMADDLLHDPLDILHDFFLATSQGHLIGHLEEIPQGFRAFAVEPAGRQAQFGDGMEHFVDLLRDDQGGQVHHHRGAQAGARVGQTAGQIPPVARIGKGQRLGELIVQGIDEGPRLAQA